MPKNQKQLEKSETPLFDRVVTILEQARTNVVRSVNSQMVIAYWLIGREIVEEEQRGEERAEYGRRLVMELSAKLTDHYRKGFSHTNLAYFRQFYLAYQARRPEILHTACGESEPILHTLCGELGTSGGSRSDRDDSRQLQAVASASHTGFYPDLSWSHYRALMRVENENARSFYEVEAAKSGWSVRQLERQIHTFYYERLLKSRDKAGMMELANQGEAPEHPLDVLKNPYVLEFLDLPESERLTEGDLEGALISHLREFLLELGAGFAFISRQSRLTLDGDHFYADLIFYHTRLKCYVVIDLKVVKLTHGDLGQMQMYVNYYDREVRAADDNPTVGLILCAEKNDAVVRYVLGEENEQVFASRYKLELPSEEELQLELQRERRLIEERARNREGDA